MKINYTNAAYESLLAINEFVELRNTLGAGYRWYLRYEDFILEKLLLHKAIPLCKINTLQRLKLYCVHYKDWTIAFSKANDEILIELLLHKSRIRD